MRVKQSFLLSLLLFSLLGLMVYLLFQQQEMATAQKAFHHQSLLHQQELIEVNRRSGQMVLMGHLLNRIDQELGQTPQRTLGEETLSRIAELSKSFAPEPFSYLHKDSLSPRKYSQERGQLLTLLAFMDMDSLSFQAILSRTTFAQADLKGATLEGVNLRGIDLQGANLQEARLAKTNLSKADLRGASLWGAKLGGANLFQAQLHRADMSWADLSEANLSESVFKGAKLIAAQLRNTNLRQAIGHYSFARGAFFNGADFTGADIFGTDLKEANFQQAHLRQVDLRETDMSEALMEQSDLTEALLRDIRVHEVNWLGKLSGWKVEGAKAALKKYRIEEDKSHRAKYVVKIRNL